MSIIKSLIFWLIIFLAAFSLQMSLSNSWHFYFVPNLILVALIFLFWRFGVLTGLAISIISGFLLDLTGASINPSRIIIMPICIIFGFILSKFIDIEYFWPRITAGLSICSFYYILLIGSSLLFKQSMFYLSLVLNLVSTAVVFYLAALISNRLKGNEVLSNKKR